MSAKNFLKSNPWIFFCIALFATNTNILPTDHLTRISALDTWIYLGIADAAPNLPASGSNLVYHGSMRFLLPYTLGLLAKFFHVSSWTMFRIAVHIGIAATMGIFWSVLCRLCKEQSIRLIALAIVCFHVYLFRLQLAFSGFLNDCLFNLGFAWALCAILTNKRLSLFLSVLVMGIGKQTVFFILPVTMAYTFLNDFRTAKAKQSVLFWVLTLSVLVAYYMIIHSIVLPFSSPVSTGSMAFGLITFFRTVPFGDAVKQFGAFMLLGLFGLLGPIFFLAPVVKQSRTRMSETEIFLFVLFLFSIVQPIMSGPLITDRSITRLEALGVIPLTLMTAYRADQNSLKLSYKWTLVCTILLFFASFHHLFSILGPDQDLRSVFAIGQTAILMLFFLLFLKNLRHDRTS